MTIDRTHLLGGAPRIPEICQGPGVPGMVSVLIPSYNRAYILGKALDSVLAQTYRPIEVIVVDDGSTDGTRELVARYGDAVRYIHQPNAGLAAARNTGLRAARGEFIALQDSDDQWTPWKLGAQVALMRRIPQLALVWTDMKAVDEDGRIISESHLSTMYDVYRKVQTERFLSHDCRLHELHPDAPPELAQAVVRHGDIFSAMFMGNLVHPPVALMRREHLARVGGLDETFAWTCEDYEFFWRVSREGWGALIEAPGMLYRVEAADQLTKPHLHLYIARGNLEALKRRLREDGPRFQLPAAMMREQLADAHAWLAEEELLSPNGRRWPAIRSFARSLWAKPRQKRIALLFLASLVLPPSAVGAVRRLKQRRELERHLRSEATA